MYALSDGWPLAGKEKSGDGVCFALQLRVV